MNIPNYKFTQEEITKLKSYRDKQKNPNLRARLIAILMIASKIDICIIAQVIGKSTATIERWFQHYLTKGIDSLNSFNYVPKKSFLKKDQISEVTDWVRKTNPLTIKEVLQYINDNYKIKYTNEGIRKLLIKNGLKLLRPKVVPGNPPSEEQQKNKIDEYFKMKSSCEAGTIFLFGDGMHLIHQNIPTFCWGDPKEPPILKTNTGRKRLNILGAYNPDTHSFVHLTGEENCDAKRAILFFTVILNTYKNAPKVILFLDNARYFKAKIVTEWLKKNSKLHVEFLPPYAPNLNLIERLWRFVKDKLVKNIYYKKYITFRAKTFQLLNHINEHRDELKTLMVEKFEIVKV